MSNLKQNSCFESIVRAHYVTLSISAKNKTKIWNDFNWWSSATAELNWFDLNADREANWNLQYRNCAQIGTVRIVSRCCSTHNCRPKSLSKCRRFEFAYIALCALYSNELLFWMRHFASNKWMEIEYKCITKEKRCCRECFSIIVLW